MQHDIVACRGSRTRDGCLCDDVGQLLRDGHSHARGGVRRSRRGSTTKDAVDVCKGGYPAFVQVGAVQHQMGRAVCSCAGCTAQRAREQRRGCPLVCALEEDTGVLDKKGFAPMGSVVLCGLLGSVEGGRHRLHPCHLPCTHIMAVHMDGSGQAQLCL